MATTGGNNTSSTVIIRQAGKIVHQEAAAKGKNLKMDFIRPDLPSKCTWHLGVDPKTSPHSVRATGNEKVLPNILHAIGRTPMVKLNTIPQAEGLKCDLYAKCEFFNPGGSVKDRIGFRMVADAEARGLLKKGCTIIEPTSGNTGIGLALACAVRGYRCVIVMPEKMSGEKVDVLRALGAQIVRTPTAAAFDSPDGLIAVSQRIQRETPDSVVLDQYTNASNPLAHYDTTAQEIYDQCDGKVDMIVCGAGTGGTLTGIGRKMRELCPGCVLVGADPEGSTLAQPAALNESSVSFYEVEGIGYDFVPTVLDRAVVDRWYKVNDRESLPLARRLIRDEGLLCGGSSGAALAAALKAAKDLKEGQRCVVLLPDGVRNYMTKFLSDQWMEARGFKECENTQKHWWWDEKVSKLKLEKPLIVSPSTTCSRALNTMKKHGFDQLPIIDKNGSLTGMATITHIMSTLVRGKVQANDPVSGAMLKKFQTVGPDATLGLVSRILETESFVVVLGKDVKDVVSGLITNIDLVDFITGSDVNKT